MKSIVLRIFLCLGVVWIWVVPPVRACIPTSVRLSPGEFVEVVSSEGVKGEVLALQAEPGALFVEIESITHPENPVYLERVFCDGREPEPWPGSLRLEPADSVIYLRFGSLGSWGMTLFNMPFAVYRISTLRAPFCREKWTQDVDSGDEGEDDGEIILLGDSQGPCVRAAGLFGKSEEPGDETEEEDGEIILLASGNGHEELCGEAEPWNELKVCAQDLALGQSIQGSLSDRPGDGLSIDVDRFVLDVSAKQDVRLRLSGELSAVPSVHLIDGQGRVWAQGYFQEGEVRLWARLNPGRYFLRVAGDSGAYDLWLEGEPR